jgi:hypothetical protein
MDNKEEFWLEENYITNVDEILELVELEKEYFSDRGEGKESEFSSKRYGPSKLFTLFDKDMSGKLKDAIFKTIDPKHLEIPPDKVVINRYEPGGYLVRHRDMAGRYWKFQLIFLRTDKPHLKIYNDKYPEGKLIEEKPGALFHMPLSLEHEVTLIEDNERAKYSLVMAWEI